MIKWLSMLLGWIVADLLWWRGADRRVRRLRGATAWRWVLGAFMGFQTGYIVFLLVGTNFIHLPEVRPVYLAVCAYIWHLFIMPSMVLVFVVRAGVNRLRGRIHRRGAGIAEKRKREVVEVKNSVVGESARGRLTRREVLAAMGVALPPLISAAVAVPGVRGLGEFRVREVTIKLPSLPADLDGLSIAQVTDLHIGRFLPEGTMERVAEATNAMQADLVVFTGDLLDGSWDGIRPGHDFIARLDPRGGMVMIEGNHDMMHGTEWFESEYRRHNLLLDESKVFKVPGRSTPVQMMGITWGDLKRGRELGHWGKDADEWNRVPSKEATARSVRIVAQQRMNGAFPILLAHHPHALDPAAEAGLPLVLAGHTHGGQIMLTKNIGAGPIRFRYWAGEYEKGGSKLFVNNGVGNWFPLRVNAPAEIVKVVLRRG